MELASGSAAASWNKLCDVIEAFSPGSRLKLLARGECKGWMAWGNQAEEYEIGWETYAQNSRSGGTVKWVEAAE